MKPSGLYERARGVVRRHPAAMTVFGIFVLYMLTRLLFLGRLPVFFDESIYIHWAQQALHDGKLLISLTDGEPPFHVWFMVPFVWAVKNPLVAGRLASVAAGFFTTLGMYLIGRELRDWKLGAWAAFFYVACPFALWYDRIAVIEALLLAVFVFVLYFALRAARSLAFWWIAVVGPALGLALLTKGTSQLLFVIVPFAYLARKEYRGGEGERPLLRWAVTMAGSYLLGFGIYSLIRLSSKFPLLTARTAVATKGLGDVLKHPLDVFFSNLGTIFSTLIVFMTPLLFVAATAGLLLAVYRKWRPSYFLWAWVLLVVLIESLVAKHWMFDTILPRFFLVTLPPLLLGAGYLVSGGIEAALEWRPERTKVMVLVIVLGMILLLAFPFYNDMMIVSDAENAVLPYWERMQYLTDWPSGWGIRESSEFLENEGLRGPVVVGSNIRGIGLPTDGLEMYLLGSNVRVEPFSFAAKEFPARLLAASRKYPTYVVYNSFPGHAMPPRDWPLLLIRKFPKDGNSRMHLYLFRVQSSH